MLVIFYSYTCIVILCPLSLDSNLHTQERNESGEGEGSRREWHYGDVMIYSFVSTFFVSLNYPPKAREIYKQVILSLSYVSPKHEIFDLDFLDLALSDFNFFINVL